MLEISPDGFVFVYTREDVFMISASGVGASARNQAFYCKNLKAFMTDYLTSFGATHEIKV